MEKNKVIFNYINKRFAAGTLMLTLLTTGLTGCASIEDINYTANESGYIQGIDGTVSYNTLKYCCFYKITNNATKEEYYTIELEDFWRYDIFTRQKIDATDLIDYKFCDRVEDYLIAFNMVKEEYTEEDLKEILNKFIETQEKESNKQLVKE